MRSQLRTSLIVVLITLGGGCMRAPLTRPAASGGLAGTSWTLERFEGSDGSVLLPDGAEYTLEFQAGDRLRARIDCNRGSGTWMSSGPGSIALGPLDLTRTPCGSDSLHDQIVQQWSHVRSYAFKDGRLHLSLEDGGTYAFEPTNDYRNETHGSISL